MSMCALACASVAGCSKSRCETAGEPFSAATTRSPKSTRPDGGPLPASSFTSITGKPCRCDAGSTIEPM